jgi:prefoldin alpha subunit
MSSEEETFRRLVVELRILEGTVETLQSRVNIVNAALTELRIASMALEGLEKEKEGAQLFVPIGGGSYVKARLESADEVIVGIGANVATERTIKEAKAHVENRITEMEKTRSSLEQQFAQVLERIQGDRARLEEISAKLREGETTKSVRKTEERT